MDPRTRRGGQHAALGTVVQHAGQEGLEAVQQPEHVGADRVPPDVEIRIDEPIGAGAAGVEERHVHAAERVVGRGGEVSYLLELRHVGGHTDGVEPVRVQLRDRGSQSLGSARARAPASSPGDANAVAAARPMPVDAPVMTATLPVEDPCRVSPSGRVAGSSRSSGCSRTYPGFDGYARTHFLFFTCITRKHGPVLRSAMLFTPIMPPASKLVMPFAAPSTSARVTALVPPLATASSTACLNSNVAAKP